MTLYTAGARCKRYTEVFITDNKEEAYDWLIYTIGISNKGQRILRKHDYIRYADGISAKIYTMEVPSGVYSEELQDEEGT